jgi:hypothetical protein
MQIIASGPHNSSKVKLNVINGLAPELTKAQAATLTATTTGFRGIRLGQSKGDERMGFLPALFIGLATGALIYKVLVPSEK